MRLRHFLLALLLTLFAVPAIAQTPPNEYIVQPGDTLYRIATEFGFTVAEIRQLNDLDGDLIVVGQRLRLTTLVPIPPRPIIGTDGVAIPNSEVPLQNNQIEAPTVTDHETSTIPSGEIVTPPTTVTPTDTQRVHVVDAGETLFAIALRYNTTVDALRRLNDIEDDYIQIGQRIVVGGSVASPTFSQIRREWDIDNTTVPADQVHFVLPGETLFSISTRLGIPLDELLASNNLSTAPLVPGQILYLPRAIDLLSVPNEPVLPAADTMGLALVYPEGMEGRRMAAGVEYDPDMLTASHRTIPLGTVVLVSNPVSERSVFVRIMDRGPVSQSYLIELSEAAASALELDPNAARRIELRHLP